MIQWDYKGEKGYGHVIEGMGDSSAKQGDGEDMGAVDEGDKGGGEFPRFVFAIVIFFCFFFFFEPSTFFFCSCIFFLFSSNPPSLFPFSLSCLLLSHQILCGRNHWDDSRPRTPTLAQTPVRLAQRRLKPGRQVPQGVRQTRLDGYVGWKEWQVIPEEGGRVGMNKKRWGREEKERSVRCLGSWDGVVK